ncbi:MAG: hypothetical protein CBC48_15475 [bacterium TMED88]|nr:threonine dehydrogenase [Deltaproteobacteria bacterium]OUV26450.1 MAG: hypothetical protein CBC48_15475 [bacterium TMED88]
MTKKMEATFLAQELLADSSLAPVQLAFEGGPESGWRIARNGADHVQLGPGYQCLEVERCGVCSTDLARPFLPFPLPQVVGHEIVARSPDGQRCVVEINASHRARGLLDSECAFCSAGLDHHCPERLVLGLHDLPGGFGRQILAPVHSILPISDAIDDDVAVLLEPFAAALHAVDSLSLKGGDRIAVLGPRRLGLLVIAALAARRRAGQIDVEIYAWSRREALREKALALGADQASAPPKDSKPGQVDVVVDTTGSPDGFTHALALARREVHLKSTHGKSAGGLRHSTELVVDELSLEAWPGPSAFKTRAPHPNPPCLAWLSSASNPPEMKNAEILAQTNAREMLRRLESRRLGQIPRADWAVVDSLSQADEAIRPIPDEEVSLVKPGGTIFIDPSPRPATAETSVLATALIERGLRVSTSRCGDFRSALALLEGDFRLRADLPTLVTHHLLADQLERAFQIAESPEAIKVVVDQPLNRR